MLSAVEEELLLLIFAFPALYSGFHNSNNENNSQCRQQQQAGESSSSLSLSAIITQALAVMEHHQSCSEIKIPTESNNTIPLNTDPNSFPLFRWWWFST